MARINVRITQEQRRELGMYWKGQVQDLMQFKLLQFNQECAKETAEAQFSRIFKYRIKKKRANTEDTTLGKEVFATLRTDDEDFKEFLKNCEAINLTVSEVMRGLLSEYIEESRVSNV